MNVGLKNNEDLQLPRFSIRWVKDSGVDVILSNQIFASGSGLVVGCDDFLPEPQQFKYADESVLVIGNPVVDDKIDAASAAVRA